MDKNNTVQLLKGYAWIQDIPSQLLISFVQTYSLLEEILNKHYQRFNLSEAKFNALFLLYQSKEGLLLSELGDQMLVTRANITGLIDRLEKNKLVERISHPTDRRSIIATITDKGIKLMEEIIPNHKKLNTQIISCLNEEEKNMAIKLTNKLSNNLQKIKNTLNNN